MFIERSAGRIRLARLSFVLVALLPCVVLAAWAVVRGSAGHREAVRARWQQAIGLPLAIAAVEHPRPGVVRARSCVVRTPTGRTLLEIPTVEVESAATEDRLRIDAARLDPQAAFVLGGLVREWLRSDARHPRNCVIEAVDFAWTGCGRESEPAAAPPAGLRIECVAQGDTRAVRIVRRAGGGVGDGDELRMVRMLDAGGRDGRERFEVDGRLSHPLPWPVLAALAGWSDGALDATGSSATVGGELHATHDSAGWSGTASGRIDEIDLGSMTRRLGARGAGTAWIEASRFAWRQGRLADAAIECGCGRGWVDTALFDRLVIALGCRPTPAARATGEPVRSFDTAGCVLELEGDRVALRASPSLGDAVAVADGAALLQAPAARVPFDRLAWMLSPPAATFVPADGPGAWLMSVLPAGPHEPSDAGKRAANPSDGDASRGF